MGQPEQFEVLVLGSGTAGKLIAWHLAQSGRRTAVVERRWIGGSCPNIACMPSKNEIASAKVVHLARNAAQRGMITGPVTVDMGTVRRRKRDMVKRQVEAHLQACRRVAPNSSRQRTLAHPAMAEGLCALFSNVPPIQQSKSRAA